jgi:hypothetical protein
VAVLLLRTVLLSFTSTTVRTELPIGPYSTANTPNSTVLLTVGQADDEEVSLAIASVTMAISNEQNLDHGFGFIEQSSVQGHVVVGGPLLQPTPRPGRLMLVPLIEARHIVLLVIQLNEHHEPTFSVLDSEAFHLKAASRQNIHNWALRLLRHSH